MPSPRSFAGCDTGFGNLLAQHLDQLGMKVYAGCLHKDGKGATDLTDKCSNKLTVLQLDVTSDKEVAQAVIDVKQGLGEGEGKKSYNIF